MEFTRNLLREMVHDVTLERNRMKKTATKKAPAKKSKESAPIAPESNGEVLPDDDLQTKCDKLQKRLDRITKARRFLGKKADAAIVNRVLNSWREFRMRHPVAERAPTILESLAEQNAQPAKTLADVAPTETVA